MQRGNGLMNDRIIRLGGISQCERIASVVNDGARAYEGHVPADCLHEPYMPVEELKSEIENGVTFWGYERGGKLVGVMGLQEVEDVVLIRHAYVRTTSQGHGIGALLMQKLLEQADKPVLIGTWKAAGWAISFYKRFGFEPVGEEQRNSLLRRYWSIPDRQVEESVVLANRLRAPQQ
jgi:N-acetylglutamate synthase-like GNAT family acetyltransferase